MAYQHHPQASRRPRATPSGRGLAARAAIGFVAGGLVAGGLWFALAGPGEPSPPLAAAQVESVPARATPPPPSAEVSERRQSETVRGTLVMPSYRDRLLTASELNAMSPDQLQQARAEIQVRQGIAGPGLSHIEAENARLIDAARQAR